MKSFRAFPSPATVFDPIFVRVFRQHRLLPPAFTAVEMMVAVAIIVSLSLLVVPIAGSIKKEARRTQCQQKLRVLGVATEGYLQDHAYIYPDVEMGRESNEPDPESPTIEDVLLAYAGGDPSAFHCPADNELFEKTGSSYFWNHRLSGLARNSSALMSVSGGLSQIPLISDKEAFHGDPNGTNFLYTDFSATNQLRFGVESR